MNQQWLAALAMMRPEEQPTTTTSATIFKSLYKIFATFGIMVPVPERTKNVIKTKNQTFSSWEQNSNPKKADRILERTIPSCISCLKLENTLTILPSSFPLCLYSALP